MNNISQNNEKSNPVSSPASPEIVRCNPEGIPDELKQLPQWCIWFSGVPSSDGGVRKRIHRSDKPDRRASPTDPQTWNSFGCSENALSSASWGDKHPSGLTFALTESDPYTVIDLDNCICSKSEDGVLQCEHWAMEIIAALGSYTERSPSGRGIHIVIKASISKRISKITDGIEIFDAEHFINLTGYRLSIDASKPLNAIREFDEKTILNIIDQATMIKHTSSSNKIPSPPKDYPFPVDNKNTGPVQEKPASIQDKIADLCSRNEKFKQTWDHKYDELGYPSASESDAALICIAIRSDEWTDEELGYLIEEYRIKHDLLDDKHNWSDYIPRTIEKTRILLETQRKKQEEKEQFAMLPFDFIDFHQGYLSAKTLVIYIIILRHMNYRNRTYCVSYEKLSEKSATSKETTRKAIKELESRNLIKKERRNNSSNPFLQNKYKIGNVRRNGTIDYE